MLPFTIEVFCAKVDAKVAVNAAVPSSSIFTVPLLPMILSLFLIMTPVSLIVEFEKNLLFDFQADEPVNLIDEFSYGFVAFEQLLNCTTKSFALSATSRKLDVEFALKLAITQLPKSMLLPLILVFTSQVAELIVAEKFTTLLFAEKAVEAYNAQITILPN